MMFSLSSTSCLLKLPSSSKKPFNYVQCGIKSRTNRNMIRFNIDARLFSAVLEPPEIDLCFALSATAIDADNIFQLMKDTIKDLIDNYGVGKIRYSVISFGSQANLLLGFDSGISDPIKLKQRIGSYSRASGDVPALDKALEMALESFKDGVTRPNAKQVLVVIVDNGSGLEEGEIALKAKELAEKGIRVIAVAVGADKQELEVVASDKRDVLSVPTSIKPSNLSKEIFVLVVTGTFNFYVRETKSIADINCQAVASRRQFHSFNSSVVNLKTCVHFLHEECKTRAVEASVWYSIVFERIVDRV